MVRPPQRLLSASAVVIDHDLGGFGPGLTGQDIAARQLIRIQGLIAGHCNLALAEMRPASRTYARLAGIRHISPLGAGGIQNAFLSWIKDEASLPLVQYDGYLRPFWCGRRRWAMAYSGRCAKTAPRICR